MHQGSGVEDRSWRFLANHAIVLECISVAPAGRLRDIAASVGITEPAAVSIVGVLVDAGHLTRTRVGRRNEHTVHDELPLRHPLHSHHTVVELIAFLEGPTAEAERTS